MFTAPFRTIKAVSSPNSSAKCNSGNPSPCLGTGNRPVILSMLGISVRALEAPLLFGQAIQLGSGQETSINQLVVLMRQVAGEDAFPTVNYAPPRPGEVLRNYVSIARAGKYLDFSPVTDLQTGLQKTWKWFHGKPRQQVTELDGPGYILFQDNR